MMIQFHSLAQFLAMGKYGPYVWPSYFVTLLVVGLNIYWARRLLQQSQREARRRVAVTEERA